MAKNDFWDYSSDADSEDAGNGYNGMDTYREGGVIAEAGASAFLAKVFGWMFAGLIVTAGAAFAFIVALYSSESVLNVASSSAFMFSLIIAEFVAVLAISLGLRSISAGTARLLFFLYAALNGVTLSYVCLAYTGASVVKAFVMTAVFFGVMALYGHVTKSDLTRFGPILMAGLITLIVMTLINIFMQSGMLDYILCLAGLGIFAGLTAYDVQKIKGIYFSAAKASGGEMAAKLSIIGALTLYLDFVNMFLRLLRLLGKRK